MSASALVPDLYPSGNASTGVITGNAQVAFPACITSFSAQPQIVWSGVLVTGASGAQSVTWTYANAGDAKLFKAGDYAVASKISGATANSGLGSVVLLPAATATTQTLTVTGVTAEQSSFSVIVYRSISA